MPKRKNAPRLQVVIEFEITSPEPSKINKAMAARIHQEFRNEVEERITAKKYDLGVGHIRVTRMVK